ncbi:MAG: hydrogenase maturation protein HypF [Alphaproteobacteria bacterium]|nr:hydrogenase maturation protein HypF [Alphaproteobacteria bacterium]
MIKTNDNNSLVSAVINLPREMVPVMGAGAFLKNTLCIIKGKEAWVSRDNGSLDNVAAVENYERTAHEMISLAGVSPIAIAHDLHPDFASTHFALNSGIKPLEIQHHHAHVAAVMAEHGIDEPVLGVALDGFGLGLNNESWGGELLRVDRDGFQRIGHLRSFLQPGGDIAAIQPWRMGAAALWALGRGDDIADRYKEFPQARLLRAMLDGKVNCPSTTSAGRLFDAACGLLGVKPVASFEGEAPMALEAMVRDIKVMPDGWDIDDDGILDLIPLLDKIADMPAQDGAELFHGTFAAALAAWIEEAAAKTGIRKVALGGGCFLNKVLRDNLCRQIISLGITPLCSRELPPGDSSVSLGQAWAAALLLDR